MSSQESPAEAWVSSGLLQGQGGPEGSRPAWDFLQELSSLPPPQFGLRLSNKEETQPCPSREDWIKDLLNMQSYDQPR